jgi:hypothetical protein
MAVGALASVASQPESASNLSLVSVKEGGKVLLQMPVNKEGEFTAAGEFHTLMLSKNGAMVLVQVGCNCTRKGFSVGQLKETLEYVLTA